MMGGTDFGASHRRSGRISTPKAHWTLKDRAHLSGQMAAPTFRITAIELYERPVVLRIPFRFGAATVTHAPQAFVRAEIELDAGRRAHGAAAEMMIPKWFDKAPHKSNADNISDLRLSLVTAASAYWQRLEP
jgi:hypothetical protein